MATLKSFMTWFRRPLSCEDVNRFIIDYLEGNIPQKTRARFEAHLANCPTCGAYFEQYLQTIEWTREDGALPIDPPEELVEATLNFLRDHYNDR